MAIKCGNTGKQGSHYHESVADVRKCFNGETVATQKVDRPASPLSEKQAKWVHSLLRQLNASYTGTTPVEALDRHGAGRTLLDGLIKAREDKAHGKDYDLPADVSQKATKASDTTERAALPEVPHGYYATPSATGNNDLDFWFVNVVTREGKWQGFRAVSRVIGGHAPVRVPGAVRRAALKAIEATGYEKAQMTFAQELGRCYRCGKTLTDDTSRELGIGPKCRAA
jgi:hypothetical protein